MATDLALYMMTPRMRRGHMIELLRSKPESGFFDADPSIARLNAEALEKLNARERAVAEAAFGPDATFTDGPLAGRKIASVSLRMQALALADRFRLASAEMRQEPWHVLPEDLSVHVPFVLTGTMRATLLGYLAANPWGTPGEASRRYDDALGFLDRNYGGVGFLLEE